MSSDPIEVLRELRDRAVRDLRSAQGVAEEQKPRTRIAALDAALASLSAPKPESAEAVAWNEMEARAAPARPEMWDVRDGQGDLYARQPLEKAASIVMQHPDQDLRLSPAPRPEASAPVGVEARREIERAIERARVFDDGSDGADAESARSVVAILSGVLAQQPAADCQHSEVTDGALRKAVLEWWAEPEYDTDSHPEDGERNVYSEPPEFVRIAQQPAAVDEARPLDEWHEDTGPVVWWKLPVDEPAWIGTPHDDDWPGYHTHWTPHPACPANAGQQQGGTP